MRIVLSLFFLCDGMCFFDLMLFVMCVILKVYKFFEKRGNEFYEYFYVDFVRLWSRVRFVGVDDGVFFDGYCIVFDVF